MVTIVFIIVAAIVAVFISWYEKYQREMFIAKVVDGQKVDQKFISQECQLVIAQLRDKAQLKTRPYASLLVLPDGQELSYRFDDFVKMKETSKLRFEPSNLEWDILRGLVKKIIR